MKQNHINKTVLLLLLAVMLPLSSCGAKKGPLQGQYKSENPLQAILEFSGENTVEIFALVGTGKGTYTVNGNSLHLAYEIQKRNLTMDGTIEKLPDGTYHLYLNDADFYSVEHK